MLPDGQKLLTQGQVSVFIRDYYFYYLSLALFLSNLSRMKKIIIISLFLSLFGLNSKGQISGAETTAPGYMSVRLHRAEWNLSYPLIGLNSDDKLVLHFDELGGSVETYYYTFVHCSKDWEVSDIFSSEYLDGFTENQVEDYQLSFNTTTQYVHYSLTFPNRDISFKVSGNYILAVYRPGESDNPVITRRFMISEDAVTIEPEIQRPKLASAWASGQQVDFKVNFSNARLNDPYRTVSATILKNGRWDSARSDLKPDFIGADVLNYNDLSGRNTFLGGNEYRWFDLKSLRYQSEFIASVEFMEGSYNVLLKPAISRGSSDYFYQPDLNGKYFVAIQEGRDFEVESDYVNVYFALPSDFPIKGADMYVYGALSDWQLTERNRMRYNNESHRYECSMLLKQGWYNYLFVAAGKDGKLLTDQPFESDHYETENEYLILIYLSEPMARYDRLIGWKSASSLPGNR